MSNFVGVKEIYIPTYRPHTPTIRTLIGLCSFFFRGGMGWDGMGRAWRVEINLAWPV